MRYKVVGAMTAEEALVSASSHIDAINKLYTELVAEWKSELKRIYELDWVDCRIFDGPVIE